MSVLLLVLVVVLLAAGALVAGLVMAGVIGARAIGGNATADMQLVPGMPSRAPKHWFGSHDPEARAYRRLRDAIRGVQASDAEHLGAGGTASGIEHQALRIEEQLVAASWLPASQKGPVLEQLEAEVANVERLCADHISRQAGWNSPEMQQELDSMGERLDLIALSRLQQDQRDSGT